MRESDLKELLAAVAAGRLGPAQALEKLRGLPFEQVEEFALAVAK